MIKKFAFTLTEILIAMTIIGIISAITVPSMLSNYQKRASAVQLRKAVTEIASAADLIINEEGKQFLDQTSVFTDEDNGLNNFFTQKFKVIKSCDADSTDCFYSGAYKAINAASAETFECGNRQYLLANSAAVCPTLSAGANHTSVINIVIDINGPDAPNTGGRDMFVVAIDSNANVVEATGDYAGSGCTNSNIGIGCYRRILDDNWKIEY